MYVIYQALSEHTNISIHRYAINFWLHRQTFPANLCYEIAMEERKKNADRFVIWASRYETGRLISVILSVYSWTSPVFLPSSPPHYREIPYCLFVHFASLFCAFSFSLLPSSSFLSSSAILHPRQRAVYRSAPTVFQPFLLTPRTNILRLSATSTPRRSFHIVWASSFSKPACSVDKDRRDRKRRPTAGGKEWGVE